MHLWVLVHLSHITSSPYQSDIDILLILPIYCLKWYQTCMVSTNNHTNTIHLSCSLYFNTTLVDTCGWLVHSQPLWLAQFLFSLSTPTVSYFIMYQSSTFIYIHPKFSILWSAMVWLVLLLSHSKMFFVLFQCWKN